MSLAPAVERDGFSYAGDLFAEASGHNRHRRATVAELKDHFKSGSEKDHPAHWFEAQLIHYGLPPSKTKAVARMRLYDAVNQNKLSVPGNIKKLESELKKEWTKNEREAKKAMKETSSPAASKSTKRKAEASNVDLTVNVGGINITVSANSTAKKARTTTKADAPSKPKATKTATPKAAAPKVAAPKSKSTPVKKESSPAPPYPRKQTARRGGIRQGPGRGGSAATTSSPQPPSRPGPSQYARRGGSFSSSAPRVPKYEDSDDDDNGPPPPYWQFPNSDPQSDSSLLPLGLLNGRYNITSPFVAEQWGHEDLELVLTLSGAQLWGRFDLGVMSGVFIMENRPWQSSVDRLEFTWRGREADGPIWYGNGNKGWLRFLGGGQVEGEIDYQRIEFYGERAPGQGTRSEVDVATMRAEWNGYNEDEYERERRSRW
ncbi:hypothetical protein GGS26DRAFT_553512 [Hypomontagnella submonticulosa]|nr:hypothetical protein GGS26DRAFT_553512 [Hypomontagnella submonticulosa]